MAESMASNKDVTVASGTNAATPAFVLLAALVVGAYTKGWLSPLVTQFGLPGSFDDIFAFMLICSLGLAALILGANQVVVMIAGTLAGFTVLTLYQSLLIRYLTLAALLFSIGAYGMVVSRNAIRVLISIELMINAVNINLVAFARFIDPVSAYGQIFAIFTLTVAAAEAAVGLAIVLAIYRNLATVDMEKFNLLKW
jgi:NAD(P)H-quinone oxidoreductase subunit 4L